MTIEEIPSDKEVVMSDFWYRAFEANGCKPCCHATGKWINVGDKFLLATVNTMKERRGHFLNVNGEIHTQEVMVSSGVDLKEYERQQYIECEEFKRKRESQGGGCYRINGKIIH
jgi:hypothetical protein